MHFIIRLIDCFAGFNSYTCNSIHVSVTGLYWSTVFFAVSCSLFSVQIFSNKKSVCKAPCYQLRHSRSKGKGQIRQGRHFKKKKRKFYLFYNDWSTCYNNFSFVCVCGGGEWGQRSGWFFLTVRETGGVLGEKPNAQPSDHTPTRVLTPRIEPSLQWREASALTTEY